MARIPEETINRIKQDISLLRLVQSQGLTVNRQGKDHVVSCPFHEEQTPSCIISPKTNLYHCFGCGAAGSVIDWVMKTQGVSFRLACEILQKDLSVIGDAQPVKRSSTKKLPSPLAASADNQTVLQDVTRFYHETLKQSAEALDYLKKRGLDHPELIERFQLGYANRTLAYRLPDRQYKAGRQIREQLQTIGILRNSGHEHFNGSLVIPVLNAGGEVVEMYGRKIRDDLRKGTPNHLYLPDAHAGVWNAEGLQGQKEVILCEALIDAMTFWVNGYKNVTASYGTCGFTPDHLAAFKTCGVERILIAYDRDDAGNQAAEKLARQLQQKGFACYRLLFPKGMDANQYALAAPGVVPPAALEHPCSSEVTPANKSLGVVIRSAEWMGKGRAPSRDEHCSAMDGEAGTPHHGGLLSAESIESPEQKEPEIPPATARAEPQAPQADIDADVNGRDITFTFGERRYRVRGLEKNKNFELLKVNILASCGDGCDVQGRTNAASAGCAGAIHVDTFDLYSARHRQGFIQTAAGELGVEENTLKKDLGKVLLKLEELQEKHLTGPAEKPVNAMLSEDEQQEALALLRDPDLLNRILSDFSRCGVVGEEINKLVGYLAGSSRKLDKPLAVVIQSTSAAGKSSLMDAVLDMMPEDERVQYSAMTGQSLFYMGETNLKHKILAIAEEEGAQNASYALKLLQSEGQITIASTGKDDSTGNMVTREYSVEGPVMLFLTTTAIDIDEELLNRCLVLTVNESREQTRAIHEAQRKRRTLAGLQAKLEKDALIKLHRNAQKLLNPLAVINPYADQLTFLDDKTRTRRDHEKYLTLIDTIAFLHQYQRDIKTTTYGEKQVSFIEVQLSDIETANRLAHEVLGRTLDELPAQTRKLLKLIQDWVNGQCKKQRIEQKDFRFSRRDIRQVLQWGDTALKVHLARLVELEYLLAHRGRAGKYEYELLFDGEGNAPHMMGLIEIEKLTSCGYDKNRSGLKPTQSGAGQPPVRERSEPEKSLQPVNGKVLAQRGPAVLENALTAKNKRPAVVTTGTVIR